MQCFFCFYDNICDWTVAVLFLEFKSHTTRIISSNHLSATSATSLAISATRSSSRLFNIEEAKPSKFVSICIDSRINRKRIIHSWYRLADELRNSCVRLTTQMEEVDFCGHKKNKEKRSKSLCDSSSQFRKGPDGKRGKRKEIVAPPDTVGVWGRCHHWSRGCGRHPIRLDI